jgi:hypothetical protein
VKRFWVLAVLVVLTSACGGSSSSTAPTTTATTPTTENWSSVLAPGGSSSRSFSINGPGTITITLNSAPATVGLGVGLPRATGGGCRLGVQVITGPGPTPQISTPAEDSALSDGDYCVQVFDIGTLTDPISFNIIINHP